MNAYGIDIFHITYRNHVSGAVTHYLIFNFLPSGNAAFNQNLSHTRKAKTVFQNFPAGFPILGNSAAAAAQGVGGTKNHRIPDFFCNPQTVLYIFYNI